MRKGYSTKIECLCIHCGETFLATPNRIAKYNRKFCSKRCLHNHRIPIIDRFFRYVGRKEPNGCILWTGGRHPSGHGQLSSGHGGKHIYAARVSYELFVGPIPAGLYVLHNCPAGDNPSCINPTHLFVGTHLENVEDMVAKERQARGEQKANAVLTAAAVAEIRQRYATGAVSQQALADEYGISQRHISDVIRRLRWKHVA